MKLTHAGQRNRLNEKVMSLQERKFFGKVTLDFIDGNLLRWVTIESEKLEDEDGKPKNEARSHGREDQEALTQTKPPHQQTQAPQVEA